MSSGRAKKCVYHHDNLRNGFRTCQICLGYNIRTFGGVLAKVYENLGFDLFVGGGKGKFPYWYYQNILESHNFWRTAAAGKMVHTSNIAQKHLKPYHNIRYLLILFCTVSHDKYKHRENQKLENFRFFSVILGWFYTGMKKKTFLQILCKKQDFCTLMHQNFSKNHPKSKIFSSEETSNLNETKYEIWYHYHS